MRDEPTRTRRALGHYGWLALSLVLVGGATASEPYLLSVSDKIAVKVVEWKAGESTFEELTALGGEYVIGADGQASFPFVGATQGAGKTTTDLAATLGAELQQALGLPVAPDVTIEIATYGPIYVSGDVSTPGEYPFAPGLTVIKALSLAGGERRGADAGGRPERELLTTSGALDVLKDEHVRLLVRRARLDAELAAAETVTLPPELAEVEGAQSLVSAEVAILLARQRQMAAQTTSLDEEVALLTREIETFEQKRAAMERQLEQAREQLGKITQLSDDGLALASRVTALETNVADLEGRLLDIDTASLQARQDIGAAERERAELGDMRISDLSLERQAADGQIAALALRISSQQALLQEAALYSGVEVATGGTQPSYSYTIIREGEEVAADMSTAVQAGDVIVARLALSP
ncbi:polysaccharide biosynthesis/export family protein [Devosia sp.]|uniref:polysaccharide biosynthesis/export family protein n=1 Tax=Devosia sp. TaxID=1871048 RepID=UPI002FCBBCFA